MRNVKFAQRFRPFRSGDITDFLTSRTVLKPSPCATHDPGNCNAATQNVRLLDSYNISITEIHQYTVSFGVLFQLFEKEPLLKLKNRNLIFIVLFMLTGDKFHLLK